MPDHFPGGPTVAAAVLRATLVAWFHGVARSLGSVRAAAGVLGLVGVFLCGWLVLGTWQLGRQLRLDPGVAAEVATPVAGVVLVLPALATLLATLYTPQRTSLNDLLAVLPVRGADRRAAVRWLSVLLGVVLGGLWAAPLALQFAAVSGWGVAAAALTACLLLALLGALAAQLVFLVTRFVARWVSGRDGVAPDAVAGLVTAVGLVWVFLRSLPVGRDGGGPVAVVAAPLRAAVEGRALVVAQLAALVAGLVVLAWAVALVSERAPTRVRRPRGARVARPGRGVLGRSLTGLEVLQWLRYPMNATFLAFTCLVSLAGLTIWRRSLQDDQWLLPSFFLLALISTVGVGSYGPTRSAHWGYRVIGRPYAWVGPKLVSVLVVWLALLGGFFLTLESLTSWDVRDGLLLLPTLVVELAAGCLVGLVLPVNREQSLGASLAEGLGVVVVVSISMGMQWLPGVRTTQVYVAVCLLVATVLVGVYVLLSRHLVDDVAIQASG